MTTTLTATESNPASPAIGIEAVTEVPTIAALKALSAPATEIAVYVLDYYAGISGGGGLFKWDAASTATANGGTVIAPDAGGTGRWRRIYSGALNVKWFGAKGDGSTDDTAAIQLALDLNADTEFPPGTYIIKVGSAATAYSGYALSRFTRGALVGAGAGRTILKLQRVASEGLQALAITGPHLRGVSVDGGFNPSTMTADTNSCVQCGADTTVEDCEIYNAQGSCLVGGGARTKFHNNHLYNFGDHAIYLGNTAVSSSADVRGNKIVSGSTYMGAGNVGMGGNRGCVTMREDASGITASGNSVDGPICFEITGHADAATNCPRQISIAGNTLRASYAALLCETDTGTDNGHRIKHVTFSDNDVIGTNAASERWGVVLRKATARVVGNNIVATSAGGTTVGIDAGSSGGSEPVICRSNDFYSCSIGVYIPPQDSVIRDNDFWTCTTGIEIANQGCRVVGNGFKGCTTGLYHRAGSSATRQTQIVHNVFQDGTTGIRFGNASRNVSWRGNEFQNNTNSVLVENGAGFNGYQCEENFFQSGGAMPTSGSTDAVAIQPRATSGLFPRKQLNGSVTWDPADTATGAYTSTTLTINGAAIGDTVAVGFSQAVPAGALLVGAVTASNTVTVTLFNNTGGNVDLASGTLRADIWKF